jgi:enoyl-CoA hydratase/carnithine racemase
MPFDELDTLMKHYLNPTVYSNMCEILDNIRAKVNLYLIIKTKRKRFFCSIGRSW